MPVYAALKTSTTNFFFTLKSQFSSEISQYPITQLLATTQQCSVHSEHLNRTPPPQKMYIYIYIYYTWACMCLSLGCQEERLQLKEKRKKNGFIEKNKISTYCDIPNKESFKLSLNEKKIIKWSWPVWKVLSSSGSQTSLMFHLNPILMIFSSLSFYTSED